MVGRGGKLLRRGAERAAESVVSDDGAKIRRKATGTVTRAVKGDGVELNRRIPERLSSQRATTGEMIRRPVGPTTRVTRGAGEGINVRPKENTRRLPYIANIDPGPPVVRAAARRAAMSPVTSATRRASVVGRRYFTQGTAGSGLNMKRAISAAAVAAVPVGIGLSSGVQAIHRKVNANRDNAQRSAETASQAIPTSSSIAAADISSPISSASTSSSDSTSTSQSPVTRTDSTTGIGGALQGEMRASAKAVRPDRDYMGESFDASLRKGVDTGRNYLKQQLASDKIDSKRQRTLLDQYDRRIGKDTLLGRDRGVGYLKNSDSDQSQKNLLAAYRGRFGNYRKNATATEIEAMAKAGAAKRGS